MKTSPLSPSVSTRSVVNPLTLLMSLVLLLSIAGCGSRGVIQTVDDSADYRSARSLPPLKKPAREQVLPSSNDDPSTTPEDVVLIEPEPQPAAVQAQPTLIKDTDSSVNDADQFIAARVVTVDDDQAVLEIDASFDRAWEYLAENLQRSDVTIFARNESAGRFSIGCGDIVDDNVTVQKRGGWSFFTREKSENLEYCALQVVEKKGVSHVSVLNRSGAIVSANSSNRVFERILNN
ncbi:outer membrane protein assembly factor BamC [Arenicella xantha]|uniref:NlpB/DapX lipoprotein n=1 Tax=Arenicella xantha TaxID=644221 RepID=A0A395JJU9_9GAMM|nr:outer membrane protein assembly factor BamC [Arenicella xantha]RBP50961.1 NlpB/DapX lipoprotein [Arenicella xantha]